ncbi:hypothetical protein OQA88_11111 [Cercophora sp. LCS_1]
MASTAEIKEHFNSSVFDKIRNFWFQNAANDEELILPTMDLAKQWFTSDMAFDKLCTDNFSEQLKAVRSGSVSASDLLNAIGPMSPLDWLGLVLLLDQVPRNCFRGPDSKIVFTVFDPVVLDITLRAIEQGIPESPEIRYHPGYRLWFYLPLQHSERRDIHELSVKEHASIFTDMKALMEQPESEVDEKFRKTREFLLANKEGVTKWEDMLNSFAARHKAVIDRFGRFPHRNEAMGREPTEEEIKYLIEGGETFGSGR